MISLRKGVYPKVTHMEQRGLFWTATLFLLLTFCGCAGMREEYRVQIQVLVDDLAMSYPTQVGEVFEYGAVRSFRLNLGLEDLGETLACMLEESGPWFEKLLLGYLIALVQEDEGFSILLDQLETGGLEPEVREGLTFCAVKYLGFTERDTRTAMTGWEADLSVWRQFDERIQKIGLHGWRREYLTQIVRSGLPDGGERALDAAAWLSHTLVPGDVPFLSDLLEKGCPRCDLALLTMIENLLLRRFLPLSGEEGLEEGIQAFRAWYEENRNASPDAWITAAFTEAGYPLDGLGQTSLAKIVPALMDDSEDWVRVRGRALSVLNRICGFHVDRTVIFMEQGVREEAGEAYRKWLQDLASRVKVE
jgi:hypothetical protein